MAIVTVDSNYGAGSAQSIEMYTGAVTRMSQSFTCVNQVYITSCTFVMWRKATYSGNVYAKVYTHKGDYGVSSLPDVLIATSNPIDASTLATSYSLSNFVTFTFPIGQPLILEANTMEIENG